MRVLARPTLELEGIPVPRDLSARQCVWAAASKKKKTPSQSMSALQASAHRASDSGPSPVKITCTRQNSDGHYKGIRHPNLSNTEMRGCSSHCKIRTWQVSSQRNKAQQDSHSQARRQLGELDVWQTQQGKGQGRQRTVIELTRAPTNSKWQGTVKVSWLMQ